MTRHCMRCGAEITACMGFVLARDVVSGRRPVRELCGLCVERIDLGLCVERIDLGLCVEQVDLAQLDVTREETTR